MIDIPNYEIGESPFVDHKKTIKDGIQYIQSKITKLEYISLNYKSFKNEELIDNEIFKNEYRIVFTKKFSEMCDLIHFGIVTDTPIIFEGEPGQGKQTAIKYVSNLLGMEIVNIVISKSTKVDDLLLKTIISKRKDGEIDVKNKKTELYEAIEYKDKNLKKLIVLTRNK